MLNFIIDALYSFREVFSRFRTWILFSMVILGFIGAPEMIDIACKIPIKGGNILDVVYDATDLELWVSYAEKQDEAYKRPFVHFKLKDYLK